LSASSPFFCRGFRARIRAGHEVEDPAVKSGFVVHRDADVIFIDALPRNATDKVLRAALRETP
jgi:acyl-coenzyme A synthetase/AMP-(fatty) acid ligase